MGGSSVTNRRWVREAETAFFRRRPSNARSSASRPIRSGNSIHRLRPKTHLLRVRRSRVVTDRAYSIRGRTSFFSFSRNTSCRFFPKCRGSRTMFFSRLMWKNMTPSRVKRWPHRRWRRGRSPTARRRVRSSHEPERVDSDRRETRGCSEPACRVRSDDRAPTSAGAALWGRGLPNPD